MKIYLDGADLDTIASYAANPLIEGFTTNPSLMRKAGITSYAEFTTKALMAVKGKPISFEVTSDSPRQMEVQATKLAALGPNDYVKIPITNTLGESMVPLIRELIELKLNVTGVMTRRQIEALTELPTSDRIISIFAGRIADTQIDPCPIVRYAVTRHYWMRGVQVLWASAREVYNVVQAESVGAHIITLSAELIAKLKMRGRDLTDYSLETVQQFFNDGKDIA